jgi:hypothetical protein
MHFFILQSPIVIKCPEWDPQREYVDTREMETSKQSGISLNMEYKTRNEVVRKVAEAKIN